MSMRGKGEESVTVFAEHTLDEIWQINAERERIFRSVTRGAAFSRPESPESIEATTDLGGARSQFAADRLISIALLESHRDAVLEQFDHLGSTHELSVRTYFSYQVDGQSESLVAVIRVETGGKEAQPLALLTTPRFLGDDLTSLLSLARVPVELERSDVKELPLLWSRGTGGVLLHESAGHPAGLAPAIEWPGWLRVVDDPGWRVFDTPVGSAPETPLSDLLSSERPAALRRASFRDHPIPRLSSLVATVDGAPFDLPESYLEIELAEGGSWDPLTDRVEVKVLFSSIVAAGKRKRVAPFGIAVPRAEVAQKILGAHGEPVRYPGVLCSEHGQRIPVGTSCPDFLTEAL